MSRSRQVVLALLALLAAAGAIAGVRVARTSSEPRLQREIVAAIRADPYLASIEQEQGQIEEVRCDTAPRGHAAFASSCHIDFQKVKNQYWTVRRYPSGGFEFLACTKARICN
jgi:hypothetical protein